MESKAEVLNQKVSSKSLSDLLTWDGNLELSKTISFEALNNGRPALSVTIRSVTSDELDMFRRQATKVIPARTNRRITQTEEVTDVVKQRRYMVFNAIISPALTDSALQQKFNGNSNDMTTIVDRVFLPGEIIELADEIFNLSGIKDDISEEDNNEENPFLKE